MCKRRCWPTFLLDKINIDINLIRSIFVESKNFVLEKPGIILKFVEPQYLDDCLNNHFWFSSYGYFHKKKMMTSMI